MAEYKGYAQRTAFNAPEISKAGVNEILRAGNQYEQDARRAEAFRRGQASEYLSALRSNQEIEAANRKMIFDLDTQNKEANFRFEMRNFDQRVAAARAEKDPLDDLINISKGVANIFIEREKQLNVEREARGAELQYQFGLTAPELTILTSRDLQIEANSAEIRSVVERLQASGASPEQIEMLKKMDGRTLLGAQKSALRYAGTVGWDDFLNSKLNEQVTLDDGRVATLSEAYQNSDTALTRDLEARYRNDYFKQFEGIDPLLKGKYLIEPMAERDEQRLRGLSAKRKEMLIDNSRDELRRELQLEMDTSSDPGQTFWDRIQSEGTRTGDLAGARRDQTALLIEQVEAGNMDREALAAVLEKEVTTPAGTKTFKEMFPTEAKALMEAYRGDRDREYGEYQRDQRDKALEFAQLNEDLRQQLYSGDRVTNAELEPIIENFRAIGNTEGIKMLSDFMANDSVDAQYVQAKVKSLDESARLGTLTSQEVVQARLPAKLQQQYLNLAKDVGGVALSKDDAKTAENFIKARLNERVKEVMSTGQLNATRPLAERFAMNKFRADYMSFVRGGMDPNTAFDKATQKFQADFDNPNGRYRALGPKDSSGNVRITSASFANFQPGQYKAEGAPFAVIQKGIREKGAAALSDPQYVPRDKLENYSARVLNGQIGMPVPSEIRFMAEQFGGTVPLRDVLNKQLKAHGLPELPASKFDSFVSQQPQRWQRFINYKPNTVRREITMTENGAQRDPNQHNTGLWKVISKAEGGYESMNRGNAGDSPGNARNYLGKDLRSMTLSEVMRRQQSGDLFAAGRYQIIDVTMPGFVSWLKSKGYDPNTTKYNEKIQDLYPEYTMFVKRPSVGAYITGKSDNIREAAQDLAREFASVGLAYPEAGRAKNQSRYAGTGSNRASITTEEIQAALIQERANRLNPTWRQPRNMNPAIADKVPIPFDNTVSANGPVWEGAPPPINLP